MSAPEQATLKALIARKSRADVLHAPAPGVLRDLCGTVNVPTDACRLAASGRAARIPRQTRRQAAWGDS